MIDRAWLLSELSDSRMKWMGLRIQKNPIDMWIYQDIIYQNKPDFLIECGTAFAGSACYFASLFEVMGNGNVITIDIGKSEEYIEQIPDRLKDRVEFFRGPTNHEYILSEIDKMVNGKKVMVVLDSAHDAANVYGEMIAYHNIVTPGQYMVIEDIYQGGPGKAIGTYMEKYDDLEIVHDYDFFEDSFNFGGYLRKK